MKLKHLIIGLFLLATLTMFAQNSNRELTELKQNGNEIHLKTNDGAYRIIFYNDFVVETTFIPKGETFDQKSHAVVLKPVKLDAMAHTSNGVTSVISDGIAVSIQHKPFQISYSFDGKELISEKLGYQKEKHQPMDLVKDNIVTDSIETISFNLKKDEALYGTGARALGMNRRGNRLPLYNRAHYGYGERSELLNFTLPMVVSSDMYIIHFDNAPIGYIDLDSKKDNTLKYETISGRKTYQIIAGDSWLDVLDNYTDLTGKQPMPPRWALGNFASRFGYRSQQETENTIAKFKEDLIPVDAVILDLYWFGKTVKGTMGNLAVYKDSFPDMEGMIEKLNQQNVKTVLITEPFILTTSDRWQEAVENDVLAKDASGKPHTYDFYFGNTGIIDVYSEKGEEWFWERYKEIIDMGVAGIWGDLGEPEVHPSTVMHATGTADEVHNIYGHDWARLVYEGYQRDYPETRPFILMRAGYSGSQRYGLIPWSGDVSRGWGGLQSQPEISLQMGMQGIGYMHSDLGGFAGANLDDELYARWLQYGVFQPIYRPHAQEDVPSEPVFRSKKAKALAKEAIELRYQLLPYNYNLAYQNSHEGAPLMRPLIFEEPSKSQLHSLSSTYLWGRDFLISPVLKSGAKEQEVYFPATSDWFDFYTGEKVQGGQTKMVSLKENSIPTYVRSGAFILMTDITQSTDEYDGTNLEVHYYHDSDVIESERTYYNDDGKTPNSFEKEKYEILEFEAELEKDWLEIDFEAELGDDYSTSQKTIELVVHNIDWTPRIIRVNGKKVGLIKNGNTLVVPLNWNTKEEAKIKISLKQVR
jgi:alpha-glucosidase (family GH31 glycosyl hydrolase)